MILMVVSTPTSDVMSTSSNSSSTSSSTVDFPTTALLSFEKKLVLLFSKPLSRVSLFPLEKNLNISMVEVRKKNEKKIPELQGLSTTENSYFIF
jgi:hypothetical protein